VHLTQAGRLHADIESTAGFPRLLTQPLPAIHALSVPPGHRQRGRAPPEDDVSLFPDGLDEWGGLGIPTVCQRAIPRPPWTVDETFAGLLIRDGNGDKR
jgi:hypothetical protein